jgi:hypothetical protein
MTLTVPISAGLTDYATLAKTIAKLGTNPKHTLTTLATPEDDFLAYQFLETLDDCFGKLKRVIVTNADGSLADRANRFLRAAIDSYLPTDERYPMLYFDPTERPLVPHWLDVLQSNYFHCATPEIFGKFLSGTPTGSILFNMNYFKTSTLINFIPPNTHWRKFLGGEMLRRNEPSAESILRNLVTK